MSKVVCRICLRTDVEAIDIDTNLVDLHDEICDYDIYKHKMLKYCSICEYQLRKFYNFRVRCNRAHRLLKTWKQNLTGIPDNLHEQMRPSISMCHNKARVQVSVHRQFDGNTDLILDPDPNPDTPTLKYVMNIAPETPDNDTAETVKLEEEEDKSDFVFITKEAEIPELFDFEPLQKNEFLDNLDTLEDIQNDELVDLTAQMQDDDLPLSNLKDERDKFDFLSDFDEEYTVKKPKKAKAKAKTKKPKAKMAEVKFEEVDDLSLAELIQKVGVDDKVVKARQKFLKNKVKLKDRILEVLDSGQYDDLGDDMKMSKEIFIKIFNRYDKCDMRMLSMKPDSPELPQKLRKFLLYLLRKYNPEYETVFHVEYLDTDEKKLQEFSRRKDGAAYTDAPFKCELCFKGFDAQSHLDYHNKWHKPTANDIVCNICPMRFVSKSTYKAHRKNNHTVVYTCKLCPVITYHFSVMINHYNQHKGVEYHCPTCLSVYTNKTTLNNHRREAHATAHVCRACARSFVSEKGLFFHRKYKHKDEAEAAPSEAATCAQCDITFDSHKVYLKHERSAHTRRPETVYKCYFCKDGFDSIEALRKHKLDLNHQRAPKQLIHRTSIGAGRGARRTRRTRVSDPDKPYRKCPVCLAEVPNTFPTSLYMHYQEAHPDVPYHSVYTDSKDYLCEQCGKTFRVYCHYLDHKNQHTGLKPYQCKECPARFATRRHLLYHAERHRPPRYRCQHCHKMFLSAANLFAHRRGHIGDRRFKCDICFKGFLHSYTLKEHIKGVHNQIRRVRKLPSRDKTLL